jgi:membrane protease YdiL (CAAX protease family)
MSSRIVFQKLQIIGIIFSIGSALMEEYQFRGILLPTFMSSFRGSKRTRVFYAIITTSFLFGINHFTLLLNGEPFIRVAWNIFAAMGLSLVLSALYLRTRSLVWSIVVHFLVDFFSYMAPFAVLNISTPEQSIIAFVIETIISVLLLMVPLTKLNIGFSKA